MAIIIPLCCFVYLLIGELRCDKLKINTFINRVSLIFVRHSLMAFTLNMHCVLYMLCMLLGITCIQLVSLSSQTVVSHFVSFA